MDPTAAADDLVADGRFRLLVHYGGPPHVQCWQAVDTVTGAQVGLTVVDREGVLPRRDIDDIVWLTARLRGLRVPGLAPVLASMRADRGALVVSEWVRGATLREVSDTAPPAMGVAAAVRPLAEAVAAAHRSGIALSIDHPARLRVSTDGRVVQCFPATLPGATPRGDLLGIGGALYAMLLNRWPSPGATPEGWHPARGDPPRRGGETGGRKADQPNQVE